MRKAYEDNVICTTGLASRSRLRHRGLPHTVDTSALVITTPTEVCERLWGDHTSDIKTPVSVTFFWTAIVFGLV